MAIPLQELAAGPLEAVSRRELNTLIQQNALNRLWAKDHTLWPADSSSFNVKAQLSWLDLPDLMQPHMARLSELAGKLEPNGFEDIVFVAMGAANLAAEAILRFPTAKLANRLILLDTIDPASIRAVEESIRLDRTLFVFSTKSGKNIETHAILLYFLQRLKAAGVSSPGKHFVALTEQDSYLAQLACEYNFNDVFLDPIGIRGRFSSLIHFDLFLSSICRFAPSDLSAQAAAMREACGPGTKGESNPALALASLLAAAELEGYDRLVFLNPKNLSFLAYRIGHLVGESTAKNRRGIVPMLGRHCPPLEFFKERCVVAAFRMVDQDDPELAERLRELREASVPLVEIDLAGAHHFGVELFKWEIAVALACALLDRNPFTEPDVHGGRERTTHFLGEVMRREVAPRIRESGIDLFAEGETRRQISTLSLSEALRTFFQLRRNDGYAALLPFLGFNSEHSAILCRIRTLLCGSLRFPVLLTAGPGYLHALGQVYKGGPAKGIFLMMTSDSDKDLAIPGAGYTFGQLQMAVALADFESLHSRERPVLRLHFAEGAGNGLMQLESVLTQALRNSRMIAT